jgi:vesicle-fusing ATPase
MREHKKLADNVNLDELAKITRNYSGAELEGLVRSATATAMNRIIKAKDRVEVDNDEADNLMVTSEDFEYAIEHDVKPAFGISEAELSSFVRNEIIHWNIETQVIISRGELVIQQTVESSRNHLVSMMIKGPAGSGKTALAVTIAQKSNFPFVKVISPENMIGYHESAKCQVIKKIFEDAYKSPVSCIVIDDIDSLLDYVSIGPRFSNVVLQALIVLLRKQPPARHRLLILGTTSLSNDTIKSLGIENAFNSSVNVPSVTKGTEVIKILQHLQFFEPQDLKVLEQKLKSAKLRIGIKHLIALSDAACQSKNPVSDFESILINEAGLHYPS